MSKEYQFSPMSSKLPGGSRNVSFSLANVLQPGEQLDEVHVSVDDAALINITNDGVIGNGLVASWHIAALKEVEEQEVVYNLQYSGDDGSADTYEIKQLIVDELTGSEC